MLRSKSAIKLWANLSKDSLMTCVFTITFCLIPKYKRSRGISPPERYWQSHPRSAQKNKAHASGIISYSTPPQNRSIPPGMTQSA
jgi:hypothetical protein